MSDASTIEHDETVTWSLPNVRTVQTWQVGAVLEKIEKVNRKALKLGVAPFTTELGPVRLVRVNTGETGGARREDGHRYKEVVDITILGAPVEVSGYRFLGRVDFEDGAILVNARPGEHLPARYRTTTPYCDHCASLRQRNSVFIFRRDGGEQHVQVGRSCLKDFMGHDPAAVLWSSSLWSRLVDEIDEECGRGGGYQCDVTLVDTVLAMAAALVRVEGRFVSRSQAADSDYMVATASRVDEQLFPPSIRPDGWVTIVPTEEDEKRAAEAKAWCLATMVKPDQSDYEYNLTTLVQQDAINIKRIGLVVSLAGVYAKHLGELVAKAKRVNEHVGEIGKRRSFSATYAGASSYDNAYGTVYIGRFDTPEGLLVYKGSSPFWSTELQPGAEIEFVATIKDHDDYRGTKQTLVQRVKLTQPATSKETAEA